MTDPDTTTKDALAVEAEPAAAVTLFGVK